MRQRKVLNTPRCRCRHPRWPSRHRKATAGMRGMTIHPVLLWFGQRHVHHTALVERADRFDIRVYRETAIIGRAKAAIGHFPDLGLRVRGRDPRRGLVVRVFLGLSPARSKAARTRSARLRATRSWARCCCRFPLPELVSNAVRRHSTSVDDGLQPQGDAELGQVLKRHGRHEARAIDSAQTRSRPEWGFGTRRVPRRDRQ